MKLNGNGKCSSCHGTGTISEVCGSYTTGSYSVPQLGDNTGRYRCAVCGNGGTLKHVTVTYRCPTHRKYRN